MPDKRCGFNVRTHHHARTIHQTEHGNIKCIAELDESRALIRTVGIDCTGKMMGIVGDHAHGVAFNTDECRDDSDTEFLPYL